MKQITLTVVEFYSFKQIATFVYNYFVRSGFVFIEANADDLDKLGF
jgi:hypothetical protein